MPNNQVGFWIRDADALYALKSRRFGGEVGLGASAGRKGGCSWIVLSQAGNIGLIAHLGATYLVPLILSYLIPSGFARRF